MKFIEFLHSLPSWSDAVFVGVYGFIVLAVMTKVLNNEK